MAQPVKGQRPGIAPVPAWWFADTSTAIALAGTLTYTDGADVAAGVGAITSSGSIAVTDGADVSAASGSIIASGTVAASDGADVASAAGGVTSSGSIAASDGTDTIAASGTVGAAAVTGTVSTTDGADVVQAAGEVRQNGGYPTKTKRRYIYKDGDKLVVTTNASAALAAADRVQELPPEEAADTETAPQAIPLAEIRVVAAQYAQQAKVLRMFRQRDWAEMVALYESLKRQQDEDDLEVMVLSL